LIKRTYTSRPSMLHFYHIFVDRETMLLLNADRNKKIIGCNFGTFGNHDK